MKVENQKVDFYGLSASKSQKDKRIKAAVGEVLEAMARKCIFIKNIYFLKSIAKKTSFSSKVTVYHVDFSLLYPVLYFKAC